MTDQSSSPVRNDVGIGAGWREVARFAAHPRLPDRMSGITPAALVDTLKLYMLDMVLMGIVLGAFLAAEVFGAELPSNELENLDLGLATILLIVIGAPVYEEIAFRGWLSGRPGAMLATPLAVIGSILLFGAGIEGERTMMVAGVIALIIAAGLAFAFRKTQQWRWFARSFPLWFWASALGFAAIHLLNYGEGAGVPWPLVIPQFLAGILFAFARVTHGMWSNILLHAMHNGTFIALALVGERFAAA